jgi:hypothetical protein
MAGGEEDGRLSSRAADASVRRAVSAHLAGGLDRTSENGSEECTEIAVLTEATFYTAIFSPFRCGTMLGPCYSRARIEQRSQTVRALFYFHRARKAAARRSDCHWQTELPNLQAGRGAAVAFELSRNWVKFRYETYIVPRTTISQLIFEWHAIINCRNPNPRLPALVARRSPSQRCQP